MRVAKFVFEMNVSLDGYIDHEALGPPDPPLFSYFIDLTRNAAGAIYGRALYEAMRYWDGDEWKQNEPVTGVDLRAFAEAWRAMPKWVVSQSLKSVGPNATLVGADVEATVRALKSNLDGDIEIGGPALASSLTALGLIDEYSLIVHPVALGAGRPFFIGPTPRLRLASHSRLGDAALKLTYVPA